MPAITSKFNRPAKSNSNKFTSNGLTFLYPPQHSSKLPAGEFARALQDTAKAQSPATVRLVSLNTLRARTIVNDHEPSAVLSIDSPAPAPPIPSKGKKRAASPTGGRSKVTKLDKVRPATLASLRGKATVEAEVTSEVEDDEIDTGTTTKAFRIRKLSQLYESRVQARSVRGAWRGLSRDQAMHCDRPLAQLTIGTVARMRIEMKTYIEGMAQLFKAIFEDPLANAQRTRLSYQVEIGRICQTMKLLLRETPRLSAPLTPEVRRMMYEHVQSNSAHLSEMQIRGLMERYGDDETLLHAVAQNGLPLTDVTIHMLMAVRRTLIVKRMPPLCNVPNFNELWDEVGKNFCTNMITSAKETAQAMLLKYVRTQFEASALDEWVAAMSSNCQKSIANAITNAILSAPFTALPHRLWSQATFSPDVKDAIVLDLTSSDVPAHYHQPIADHADSIFIRTVRDRDASALGVPGGITMTDAIEGRHNGSPLQLLPFLHHIKQQAGYPYGICQVSQSLFHRPPVQADMMMQKDPSDYASREFIPIKMTTTISFLNQPSAHVEKTMTWFNTWIPGSNFSFNLTDGWDLRLANMRREIQGRLGLKTFSYESIAKHGLILALADLLFHTETLPPYQVPTGSILTDGGTVLFRTVDISRGRIRSQPSTQDLLDAPGGHDFRQLFLQSAGGTAAFKEEAHEKVDFKSHWRKTNDGRVIEMPIRPTLQLGLVPYTTAADRLGEANRRAQVTGRRFVSTSLSSKARATKNGLPVSISNLEQDGARTFLLDHGVSEEDIDAGRFSVAGNDPGFAFNQAISAHVRLADDQWVRLTLLSKPTGEQACVSNHIRVCQELTTVERDKLGVTSGHTDPRDIMCRNSPSHLKARYELRRRRRQHVQRKIDQIAQTMGLLQPGKRATRPPNLITPAYKTQCSPIVFALGGSNGPMRHVKQHAVDTRNSTLRAFAQQSETRRWPVLIGFVSEYLTSQICPNVACRTSVGSRLIYPKVTETGRDCLRITQCPTCHKVFHRDLGAAANIQYVATHLIAKGSEPFRQIADNANQPSHRACASPFINYQTP